MWPQISGILGILDFGSWGFWILVIWDFGLWGFWILDFGPLCSKSLCEAPNAPNLGIWNFGFWGFWILRFGGWKSLGAKFVPNFGFYIRVRRLCTPPRVGGLFCWQGQHEETFFKSTLPYFEWDGFGLGARFCAWKVLRGSIQVPASEKTISNRRKTRQNSNLSNLSNFSTSKSFFFCFPSWDLGIPSWCQEVGGFVCSRFSSLLHSGDLQQFSPRRKSSVKT